VSARRARPPALNLPGLSEIPANLCPGGSGRRQKSPILNSKLVEGTGHYLNSLAQVSSGVLELLRAH